MLAIVRRELSSTRAGRSPYLAAKRAETAPSLPPQVPAAAFLSAAALFPNDVPSRDVKYVLTLFFVIGVAGAYSVRYSFEHELWYSFGHEAATIRAVRRLQKAILAPAWGGRGGGGGGGATVNVAGCRVGALLACHCGPRPAYLGDALPPLLAAHPRHHCGPGMLAARRGHGALRAQRSLVCATRPSLLMR